MYEMAHMWRRRNLTLVYPAVTMLRILYLQRPIVRLTLVNSSETLVTRVRVTTHSQKMNVPVTDPGHLECHLKKKETVQKG